MINEVFELMKNFPESFINMHGDLILDNRTNMFITVKDLPSENELIYKILERCSRTVAKAEPYSDVRRNRNHRRSLLLGVNNYLKTNFSESDMWLIYDRLGDGISRKRTIEFVKRGYDINYLKKSDSAAEDGGGE